MPKKRYTPEEIMQHLRTVELDTGKGLAVRDACRKLGITEQTYSRWKKEYGGLRVDHAKRLKGLEQEHLRLKRIVADQTLDLSILKEVSAGHFSARPAGAKPWSTPSPCSVYRSAGHVGQPASSGPPLGTCRSPIPIASGCASASSP
jgi:putative transposase